MEILLANLHSGIVSAFSCWLSARNNRRFCSGVTVTQHTTQRSASTVCYCRCWCCCCMGFCCSERAICCTVHSFVFSALTHFRRTMTCGVWVEGDFTHDLVRWLRYVFFFWTATFCALERIQIFACRSSRWNTEIEEKSWEICWFWWMVMANPRWPSDLDLFFSLHSRNISPANWSPSNGLTVIISTIIFCCCCLSLFSVHKILHSSNSCSLYIFISRLLQMCGRPKLASLQTCSIDLDRKRVFFS